MSSRPDLFSRHSLPTRAVDTFQLPQVLIENSRSSFQHVISLGPRCTNTSSVYKAQRKYAGPFDWIFSSPQIVIDCLRDNFTCFLDRSALSEVGTKFDAIGLPPGSAPRKRALIGHERYSEMTNGVGRGVIFNHHNPLLEEGYDYVTRCAQRFLLALRLKERKLYSFINIDSKLWNEDAIIEVFHELSHKDHGSFLLLAVNCIKNCGDDAMQNEPRCLHQCEKGNGVLAIMELQCVGDNTGSYFREAFDAQRIQALMVQPFAFSLSEDPLLAAPLEQASLPLEQPSGSSRRWVANRGDTQDKKVLDQSPHTRDSQRDQQRLSRWGRAHGLRPRMDAHESQLEVDSTSRIVQPHISLRRGLQIPALGLGTWQLSNGGECRQAVEAALKCGCCLIDTASAYKNEDDVGAALKSAERQQVFLVTKLQSKEHGDRNRVFAALRSSLHRLGVEYIDLYLIHSPRGGYILETWDAMLEARDAGLVRAVGVSNFGVEQLEALKASGRELPEVNQIECHLWLQQKACATWCAQEGIALMAYSPLARGKFFKQTKLAKVAENLGCTEAEVAIRWSLNKGFIVIPKSANAERIKMNMSTLMAPLLDAGQMAILDTLDVGKQSCAAASDAMVIPSEQVFARAVPRKGKGKGKK